jgi:hypothetical protein
MLVSDRIILKHSKDAFFTGMRTECPKRRLGRPKRELYLHLRVL